MKLDLEKKVKIIGLCGVLAAAGNLAGFRQDVKANPPATVIGDDGHPAAELSATQTLEFLGGMGATTVAGAAFLFAGALRKEREQAAKEAAKMAAKMAAMSKGASR